MTCAPPMSGGKLSDDSQTARGPWNAAARDISTSNGPRLRQPNSSGCGIYWLSQAKRESRGARSRTRFSLSLSASPPSVSALERILVWSLGGTASVKVSWKNSFCRRRMSAESHLIKECVAASKTFGMTDKTSLHHDVNPELKIHTMFWFS